MVFSGGEGEEEKSMKKGDEIKRGVKGGAGGSKPRSGDGRNTSSFSRRLILFGVVFSLLSVGILPSPPVGAKVASAFDDTSCCLIEEVLPYGYSAGDIYRLLFDFAMRYINGDMEPEMVLRTFFEIFLALEDGVLTEGEFRVIMNSILL